MDSKEFVDLLTSSEVKVEDLRKQLADYKYRSDRLEEKVKDLEWKLDFEKKHDDYLEKENQQLSFSIRYACFISSFIGALFSCILYARHHFLSYSFFDWAIFAGGSILISLLAALFFGSGIHKLLFTNFLLPQDKDHVPFLRDLVVCIVLVALFVLFYIFLIHRG